VVTQFTGEPPTLAEYIRVPDVYACGRLDKDSEGLLLLTSDGALQHRIANPRFKQPKVYWAQVEGLPTAEALRQLRSGVLLDGVKTRPAEARLMEGEPEVPPRDPPIRVRLSIPAAWIELTLTEGRNRQVRRMTAAVGFPTLRLIRVAIGGIRLQGLAPGRWRDLTPAELATLKR
jgi:23S rRNA pseudouridine2457 synthase